VEQLYPLVEHRKPKLHPLLRGTNGQGQVKVEDILFDAGFESKDEALAYGVLPGDTIVPQTETIKTRRDAWIITFASF
jgi:glutamyl aminopeptidase